MTSSRYDGATLVGDPTLGGIWVTVALQNPTISFKTNMNLARGAWHTVRIQTIANTPGVANGRLRVWVDGVQALINTGANDPPKYLERTNVMYFSAGQMPGRIGSSSSLPTPAWRARPIPSRSTSVRSRLRCVLGDAAHSAGGQGTGALQCRVFLY